MLGVATVDREGRLTGVSATLAAMIRRPMADLRGSELAALLPLDAERLGQVLSGGTATYETECRYLAAGEPRWGRVILAHALGSPSGGATLVLENITERRRTAQRLAAQHSVARILAESTSLREAAPRILQAICECLEWDVGALWAVDGTIERLRFVEAWSAEGTAVPDPIARSQGMLARGEGLSGHTWSLGTPVWFKDFPNEAPMFMRGPVAAREGLHGAFAFPIAFGRRVVAVMDFFSHEVRKPDRDVLQMVLTFGKQIGQFVERKRVEDDLRGIAAQLTAAEDEERRNLARALHESVGQTLTALQMELLRSPRAEENRAPLALVEQLIGETRTMTFELYPTMLDDLGLLPALHAFAERFTERTGVKTAVSEVGDPVALPRTLANYLFRATRELLNNVAKHARATEALIAVHWTPGSVRVSVSDDGVGFDPDEAMAPERRRGLGLADLRERVRFLGGRFLMDSHAGRGSQVVMELPLGGGRA
jgi:signal transduction histidine kinase